METATPVNYRLSIEPDLEAFVFQGRVIITLDARKPIREVRFHARELEDFTCRLGTEADGPVCRHRLDDASETLRITLPEPTAGRFQLAVAYRGTINDRMAGFYRSRHTADGATRYMAVTQFQESDARRAFPCIDHPAAKATFDIELTVDAGLTAISNGGEAQRIALSDGKTRFRFHTTPRMSTYLVFWGVGPFTITEDDVDRRVRSVTLPGMAAYGAFGREFGRKALEFCEAVYRIPYPLSKLDLIAIPDFAYGAMENWGAITFRENLLLHYPETTSRLGEARICEVIAHEIVHQWFGNLATPSEWTYLWLNESFATYFGYGIVDHYHPEWQTWGQFLNGQTLSAMHRDALSETIPIEMPGGRPVAINTSTAPIIYSKGGSVLRQIEGFVGRDAFREGLRIYLNTHAYACAESHHLWEAMETAANQPVTAIMKSWIEQPGFPLVQVRREGADLLCEQRRFTYLPDTGGQTWRIPLTVAVFDADGGQRTVSALFEGRRMRIEIGDAACAYKVNAGQSGFYRVRYDDPRNLEKLGEYIETRRLCPEDRWGLDHDSFALALAGDRPLTAHLDFLGHYAGEDHCLPLSGIADNLLRAFLIATEAVKASLADRGRTFAERILGNIGYAPRAHEAPPTAILRDQWLWLAVLFGSDTAASFASDRFRTLETGGDIHPDIRKSVLMAGAHFGDAHIFAGFVRRIRDTSSEHDRMNLLTALGCFRDAELIEKARQYLLAEVPDRIRFVPIAAMCQNPQAIPTMWSWYVAHIAQMEQSHPLLYERVVASIVPLCGPETTETIAAFFEGYVRRQPHTADVVRMSLERRAIHCRARRAWSGHPS